MQKNIKPINDDEFQLVSVLDENAIIYFVSDGHVDKLGYNREELEGRCAFEFVHTDDLEKVKHKFSEMVESRQPTDFQYRFRHKDSKWVFIESSGIPLIEQRVFVIRSSEKNAIDLISIVKRIKFDCIRAKAKQKNIKKGVGQ